MAMVAMVMRNFILNSKIIHSNGQIVHFYSGIIVHFWLNKNCTLCVAKDLSQKFCLWIKKIKYRICDGGANDGADGNDDDSVQVLDLETGRWEDGPSLPSPR